MNNVGTKFNFLVYAERWKHKDYFYLTKVEDGWHLTSKFGTDTCDKGGSPFLLKALEDELISYPYDLEYFLLAIWNASETKSAEEVQGYFNTLAEWISHTEETKPNFSS